MQPVPHYRLKVVNVNVKCPYGEGYGNDGRVELKDCFMDSATPGTRCSQVSLGRCDQVQKFKEIWGWRSHYVWPQKAFTHIPSPVRLFYAPLNREGTQWMAINAMTGERQEVRLEEADPYDQSIPYSLYLSSRRLARKTTYGAQLCEPYHGWAGGGEVIEKKMWCDCSSCVTLRPKEQTGKDLRQAYRDSLPPEYRVYWDRYEAIRVAVQEGAAGEKMDFVNGGPAGSQRKIATIKSHKTLQDQQASKPAPVSKKQQRKLDKARKRRDRGEPLDLARLLSKEIRRLTKAE